MKVRVSMIALLAVMAVALVSDPSGAARKKKKRHYNPCIGSAISLIQACRFDGLDDYNETTAVCLNLSDREEAKECWEELRVAYGEKKAECSAQYYARLEVCQAPGFGDAYDPEIDPENFVEGIDNPYAPYAVGRRWVYEKPTDEGLEVIEIEVLDETKEIEGVECTVVRDTVRLDGVLVEDTLDWLAQDRDGNVWYFGEIAQNFDEDGELTDLDGSWKTGEDGAKPGFWMPAAPSEGQVYRQELLWAEAEDVAEVLSTDSDEDVPFANGGAVLQTRDFTPLEPDVEEHKFYVPGVGLVKETDPEGEEDALELVEFTP